MSRPVQLHYERVTFSFPSQVLKRLRSKVEKNKMSQYVAKLVDENLTNNEDEDDQFFNEMRKFRETCKPVNNKSCVEMIKEFRNGKK
ncbi:hypothetical protein HY604_01085 [Candidatus Peregrinibacteria bacterium]|nr:hypothetical protein [Candidatus Peregrinibacteria bacterium]